MPARLGTWCSGINRYRTAAARTGETSRAWCNTLPCGQPGGSLRRSGGEHLDRRQSGGYRQLRTLPERIARPLATVIRKLLRSLRTGVAIAFCRYESKRESLSLARRFDSGLLDIIGVWSPGSARRQTRPETQWLSWAIESASYSLLARITVTGPSNPDGSKGESAL